MGKGDKKTRKGKIAKKSYGKTRLRNINSLRLIKPESLRKWSKERLYVEIGQFDFTITIVFKKGSSSFNEFGEMITGLLYYTKNQRRLYRIKFNSGIKFETDGKILFTSVIKDRSTEEQINLLSTKGFDNTDILTVDYYGYKRNPTYFNKKNKKLEDPLLIRIPNIDNLSSLKMLYNLYRRRMDTTDKLIDFEKLKMMAIQKCLDITETDKKYIFNEIVQKRKAEFDFLVEDISIDIEKIKTYSDDVLKNKLQLSQEIVDYEFEKAGINPKKILEMKGHYGLYSALIQIGIKYEDKIILYATNPKVILDFKGFMHVVFRHCTICKIGNNNLAKSRIPYKLSDIEDLIKSCLHLLEDDINNHFTKHPKKRFSRYGDKLIRFNGDYYEIHINTKGIIETFYNHEK